MGIKIVADEVYRSRTRRVLRQMQRIQDNADVAAVVNIGFGGTTAYITQQFRRMKFKIPLYQSHAAANQDYLDLAGPAAEGVRMPVAPLVLSGKLEIGDPVRPVIAAYNKLYLGRWEVLPSVYGAHAHDAIQILIAAIRKARSTNKAALRRTIEATRGLIGTSGIYRINADDHLGLDVISLRMAEVWSGAWEPVD
jgi:branched-chain amino acid transport system substrate-binding protein